MDTPVEQLLRSMSELSSMFSSRMGEFEKNLSQPSTTAPTPTLKALTADFHTFKAFVWKTLGLLKSQVELVILNIDRLETHSRRKVLLFHGIKEEKDEDILQKTIEILSRHMKLPEVKSASIESCHRLGTKKDSARPVIIRFTSLKIRSNVWNAKTSLKGTKITMTEFLTKSRQEVFLAARKHFGIRKCWSADGMIVILLNNKSRVKISSVPELKRLIEQNPLSKSTVNN